MKSNVEERFQSENCVVGMSSLDITEETEGGREGDEGEVSGRKEKRQRQRRVLWRNGRGQGGRRECATLAWG